MNMLHPRLWIHLLLIIAMLALLVVGCEEETTPAEETVEPPQTEISAPTPTDEAPTTEVSPPVSPDEPTPTVSPDEPTATVTPTVSPTVEPSPPTESEYPDEAPPLPPSFGLDADAFASSNDGSAESDTTAQGFVLASFDSSDGAQPLTQAGLFDRTYWNHASGNVFIWTAIIVIGLAVPVAAFIAAHHNIPYKEDDKTWVWSYDVSIVGIRHTAELYGTYIPDGVKWEMLISKAGAYTDFSWYRGESNLGATDGFWIMKENPSNPNDLLRIDWERNPYEGTNEAKYMNIKPGGPENGGYILTKITNDSPYDASWDIYNKGKDNHTYIEWNRSSQEGRVKDSKHFGDSEWHCWDSSHDNTECL